MPIRYDAIWEFGFLEELIGRHNVILQADFDALLQDGEVRASSLPAGAHALRFVWCLVITYASLFLFFSVSFAFCCSHVLVILFLNLGFHEQVIFLRFELQVKASCRCVVCYVVVGLVLPFWCVAHLCRRHRSVTTRFKQRYFEV